MHDPWADRCIGFTRALLCAKLRVPLKTSIGEFEEDLCAFSESGLRLLPPAVAAASQQSCTCFAGHSIKVCVEFSMTAELSDTFVAAPITKLLCFFSSLQSILEIADR